MKKTFLTFVAVAFGMGVAFAQTTPQTEEKPAADTEQTLTIDKMSDKPAEAASRNMKIEELPAAVQKNLIDGEFKGYKVVSVAEVEGQEGAQAAGKQYQLAMAEDAAATEATLVVLFDENGNIVSRTKSSAKVEDKE